MMAIVGEVLTAPEEGWKRYDDTDSRIQFIGLWTTSSTVSQYEATGHNASSTSSCTVQFRFYGKNLRLIGASDTMRSNAISVTIDGKLAGIFSQSGNLQYQVLDFSLTDMEQKIHIVEIATNGSGNYNFDAIDIDDTGYLVEPVVFGHGLLRITMNDSSEREYKLSSSEIDDFITWFNRTIGTGTTGYVFNKSVQNSKEYLSFEKIISFEVIPLTE